MNNLVGFFLNGQSIRETVIFVNKYNRFINPLSLPISRMVSFLLRIQLGFAHLRSLGIDFCDDLFGCLFLGNNLSV